MTTSVVVQCVSGLVVQYDNATEAKTDRDGLRVTRGRWFTVAFHPWPEAVRWAVLTARSQQEVAALSDALHQTWREFEEGGNPQCRPATPDKSRRFWQSFRG